jgi:hypothetical protein
MRSPVPYSLSLLALAVLLPTAPSPLAAQLVASERGSVSQTIDGTTTTVNYSRPMARGRTGLFGSRVHWGETWTPGANDATKLTVTKDVTIEGQAVPRGSYSVWIVVGRGPWEMVLDRDTTLYHDQSPKERPGQIRFPVSRETRPFMEGLTWWFPRVSGNNAILAMQWDTVYVPLHLKVPSSYSTAVTPAVARRLTGVYQVHFEPDPVSADTTLLTPVDPITPDLRFTIRQEGTELRGVMDPPLYQSEEGYRDWILIPIRDGGEFFRLGRFVNGELIEVFDFFALQFDSAGDRAATFEARETNDRFMGRGTRVP